jgi:hypothetical protein
MDIQDVINIRNEYVDNKKEATPYEYRSLINRLVYEVEKLINANAVNRDTINDLRNDLINKTLDKKNGN